MKYLYRKLIGNGQYLLNIWFMYIQHQPYIFQIKVYAIEDDVVGECLSDTNAEDMPLGAQISAYGILIQDGVCSVL